MNLKTLALITTTTTVIALSGCSKDGNNSKSSGKSELTKRYEATLHELAIRHSADANWMEALPDRGGEVFFTIDLARAMIRTNGESIALQAELQDVSEREGVFTASFSSFSIHPIESGTDHHYCAVNLRLELRCSREQAENLLKLRTKVPTMENDFAVIANIQSVARPIFEAVTPENGESYQLTLDSTPDVFCAKGTCVDLTHLDWRPQ